MSILRSLVAAIFLSVFLLLPQAWAATAQNVSVGEVHGVVFDPTGAVIPGAQVTLSNAAAGFSRTVVSNEGGAFSFSLVPFHSYRLTATAAGFSDASSTLDVRSPLVVTGNLTLKIASADTTVTVAAVSDFVETDPTFHTDVDRGLFNKMPLESASSGVSSLVTLSTPGISADSDGMMHGMGDHAQNSFSIDGQPITDQQSKTFSNQIPLDAVQSLEAIAGAPPAEYGGKTSVVVKVVTRSGLDAGRPTGSLRFSYGSFGTVDAGGNLALGSSKAGNFLSVSGLRSGRFLDTPELRPMHDRGNEENFFDRADFRMSANDSAQLNLGYSRSWFQTPWSYDNLDPAKFNPELAPGSVPATDQRAKIDSYNAAPSWTHTINNNTVLTTGLFFRKDQFHYYPSANPLSDLGPANLQRETVSQSRSLTNYGVRSDIAWVHGGHNVKAGVSYTQTLLRESDGLGVVDPTLNAPCLTAGGDPVTDPTLLTPAQCAGAGYVVNPDYVAALAPYDYTRPASGGAALYRFTGRTAVKETALYVQDAITAGNWLFNLGLRGDLYNGLTVASQAEPRIGVSYNLRRTGTVLRASYARTLETPFNENLVLSSKGCDSEVVAALVPCVAAALPPGYRNEFHAGFQQGFGRYLIVSGEYIWKYTHNAYDFSVLGNTPITFPIAWHNSKIPGFALNARVPNIHGFSAEVVMSSVAARFFSPQVGGLGTVPTNEPGKAFRIDHDERFNQTTHLQYQVRRKGLLQGLWAGGNWRYDSGQVAGQIPFATDALTPVDLSGLSYDQQAQAGIVCNGVAATPTQGFRSCAPAQYSSTRINIPAPGTEDDDRNPPRIRARNLFDLSLGQENLFHADRYKVNLDMTIVNLTNETALYNFLSTFSGTHFVAPRSFAVKATLNF